MSYEYKVYIDGYEYGMDQLESIKIEHPLFDKLSVGNTCAAELEMSFWPIVGVEDFDKPGDSISKMAEIIPYAWDAEKGASDDALAYQFMAGIDGISPGEYFFVSDVYGRFVVRVEEKIGTFGRITLTIGDLGVAEATVEQYDWFSNIYMQPQKLDIYPSLKEPLPALLYYSCMHLNPEDCWPGGCDENPVIVTESSLKAWKPLGVFYIDTRSIAGEKINVIAYDGMLKGDIVWTPDSELKFPMSMPDAVAEICRLMNVELDSRTVLNPDYTIDHPANDWTLRDCLGFIGAAHGGNWTFTAAGKLLLVPLFPEVSEEAKASVLISEDGSAITFGGERIKV